MKPILYVSALMAMLASCSSDKPKEAVEPPAHVISQDSMAFHLSQIHILDAALRHRDVRKQSLQLHAKKAFDEYFDTAGVSRERFELSMAYWERDFKQMAKIYDLSMEQLSTKLAQLKQNDVAEEEEIDDVEPESDEDSVELRFSENFRITKPKTPREKK